MTAVGIFELVTLVGLHYRRSWSLGRRFCRRNAGRAAWYRVLDAVLTGAPIESSFEELLRYQACGSTAITPDMFVSYDSGRASSALGSESNLELARPP